MRLAEEQLRAPAAAHGESPVVARSAERTAPVALKAALAYTDYGWRVFPCTPKGKTPLTKHGSRDATGHFATIEAWADRWPSANVAVATGVLSGLVVLDVDGVVGKQTLGALECEHGSLPQTVESLTGGGGRHLFFRHPGVVRNSVGRLGPGLDVRGDGGYVIVPPSLHPEGKRYVWRAGHSPDEMPLAEVPAWLIEKVREQYGKLSPRPVNSNPAYAEAAMERELDKLTRARPGERNDTLNHAAFALGRFLGAGTLSRSIVERALLEQAVEIGLPVAEAQRTIASGINAALKEGLLRPLGGDEVKTRRAEACQWPDPPAALAFYGLAGNIVRAIEPESEADPVAILVQLLVAFGNMVGRGPYFVAESDLHHTNLFVVNVGATSKGRKGSSFGRVRNVLSGADPLWTNERILSGLSSGEGLVWAVRDSVEERQPIKEKGRVVDYELVVADPGVEDKRLLCFESEFCSVLRLMRREQNILSTIIRQAWDSGHLRSLTKTNPAKATGAHISVIGHTTKEELLRYLDSTEAAAGFANRFVWVCVRRSKVLPEGGAPNPEALRPLEAELASAAEFARGVREVKRDAGAREMWARVYPELSEGKPGLFGAVIARAEAQAMRLAMIYTLLDKSTTVRVVHLEAALALWEYAESSARFIFGDALCDPLADGLLAALKSSATGMTRTEISAYFGRNRASHEIDRALNVLQVAGLTKALKEETAGRSAERWIALV